MGVAQESGSAVDQEGRTRYRGLPKVRLQNYLIGAACNAKRWLAHLGWEIRHGVEVLAGATMAAATG